MKQMLLHGYNTSLDSEFNEDQEETESLHSSR